MEIYLFTTEDVEKKFQEVTNNLNLLNYMVNGLGEINSIDNDTVIALNSLIYRALESINQLTHSRTKLTLNYDPKTMYFKSSLVPGDEIKLD